jgi:hypothetical protein
MPFCRIHPTQTPLPSQTSYQPPSATSRYYVLRKAPDSRTLTHPPKLPEPAGSRPETEKEIFTELDQYHLLSIDIKRGLLSSSIAVRQSLLEHDHVLEPALSASPCGNFSVNSISNRRGWAESEEVGT